MEEGRKEGKGGGGGGRQRKRRKKNLVWVIFSEFVLWKTLVRIQGSCLQSFVNIHSTIQLSI